MKAMERRFLVLYSQNGLSVKSWWSAVKWTCPLCIFTDTLLSTCKPVEA
jgi:hypothetical protein